MSPSSSGDLVPSPRPVDVYFSADVECDGPVPGLYSMLSFGFVAAAEQSQDQWRRMPNGPTFYRELAPISEQWDNEALEVSGLDRTRLAIEGAPPSAAMRDAFDWIERVCDGGSPVLVCYPRSFDWLWLYWYFVAFSRSRLSLWLRRLHRCQDANLCLNRTALHSQRPRSCSR